jgi:multidrug efflux pump subunit AcrB
MEALTFIPAFSLTTLNEEAKPKGLRERLLEFFQRTLALFQHIAETPVEGPFWPLVLSLAAFAILIAVLYLTGLTHVGAGP